MKSVAKPAALPRRTTHDLTPAERGLVEVMRQCQFGRIENLQVEAGQPVLRPGTRVVRVSRISGATDQPAFPVQDEDGFELKAAVWDLLDQLKKLNCGSVLRLEFRSGLPCLLETEAEVV